MKIQKYIPIFTIILMGCIIIGQNIVFMTGDYRFLRASENPYNTSIYYPGSPYPRVTKDMITVDNSKACIYGNYEWSSFTATGSMFPTLDYGHFAFHKVVSNDTEIYIGDIIAYHSYNITIIHRVIDKGYDNKGLYYITQGDNLKQSDPYKIRQDMIERVAVAIIY